MKLLSTYVRLHLSEVLKCSEDEEWRAVSPGLSQDSRRRYHAVESREACLALRVSESVLTDLVKVPPERQHGNHLWERLSTVLRIRQHYSEDWTRIGGEVGQRRNIERALANLQGAFVNACLLHAQLEAARNELASKQAIFFEATRPHPYHGGEAKGEW